jgi:RNA polymerase sigma-70 factor, ECF subfamily
MSRPHVLREDAQGSSVTDLDEARRRRRLETLAREHRDFLRALAGKLCRSQFDPDDLVQDTLERTVQHLDRIPVDANHRAWMARVLHNLFIDRCRRRASSPPTTDAEAVPLAAPVHEERPWWEQLDAADVRRRLDELPAELRGAFELHAFEGCSYKEIAERLQIPMATVGTRILRARRRLKELLARAEEAP